MAALRYLDAPRRDPTADAVLRRLVERERRRRLELPRLPTLARARKRDALAATIGECLAAKGGLFALIGDGEQ